MGRRYNASPFGLDIDPGSFVVNSYTDNDLVALNIDLSHSASFRMRNSWWVDIIIITESEDGITVAFTIVRL